MSQLRAREGPSFKILLGDFCDAAGIELHLVADRGHTLGVDYVANVLDDWLLS